MKLTFRLSLILQITLFTSCNDDLAVKPLPAPGLFDNGVFIVNEGPFQSGTGTISFFDHGVASLSKEVFQVANNRPLGNIVQSLEVHDTLAYIVVNNANKMEIADLDDFASVAVIDDLPLPRFFIGLDNSKGYVSCWGPDGVSGQVRVIDLKTFAIAKTIPTGSGSGDMEIVGTTLFVCNGGGFGSDNTVSVINTQTDEVEETITVGDNPNSILKDASGNLWVACAGNQAYNPDFSLDLGNSTVGSLVRLDPLTRQVTLELEFADVFSSPSRLVLGKDETEMYYLSSGSIYIQEIGAVTLSSEPLVQSFFYGLGFDTMDEIIYAADAGDFNSNGQVIRYSTDGVPQDTLTAGIVPTSFYFN